MPERKISFLYDAPELSPAEAAAELAELARRRAPRVDFYSRGGVVAEFEAAMAAAVGKERAVFMPTGTLANHLAVRRLAAGKSRVLLQEQGHLWNDSGDCLQRLSGLAGVPLGPGRASFTLEEAEAAWRSAADGRVETGIGCLVIETPVRRRHGELFDPAEAGRLCAWARQRGIGLHLDGARLFIASACTGKTPAEYAAPFDTVYVSLYKYFGAPSGAVLAGPAGLLDEVYHERRMFGGGLNQAWPSALPALAGLDGFIDRFRRVMTCGRTLLALLAERQGYLVVEPPNCTNVFRLEPPAGVEPVGLRSALEAAGVRLPEPEAGGFWLKLNESLLGAEPEELAGSFERAGKART